MSTDRRERPRHYQAYLLRVWQVESDGCLVWRASLEDTHTGQRCGFADLARLFEYLRAQTDAADEPPAE